MQNLLTNSINWTTVLIVVAIVAVLAVLFSVLIVLISKLCAVKTDEKESQIMENLASANCGGCGFNGCQDFAKALLEGKADLSMCGPTPNENKKIIAKILEIPFSEQEEKYAVVKCAGGINATNKYDYIGLEGCGAQSKVLGGKKTCPSGCLGGCSCVKLCPYHAIKLVNDVAYVDKSLCESCGVCVKVCPKTLIELIPKTAKVYVACSSKCKGKEVIDSCKVGCIACGLCAKACPENAIEMIDNLPAINYSKCTGCLTCVEKCPRKTIRELTTD